MAILTLFLSLAAATTLEPTPLKFGYLTAGDLEQRCRSSAPTDASYCFAYVAAVHDTVRSYEKWLNMREFCAPSVTAQADLRTAFVTYVRAHPDTRGAEAASVVVVAFKQHYPCAPLPPTTALPQPAPPKAPPLGSKKR